jgi:small neutral amino acid transporter SnatA (MarC family)
VAATKNKSPKNWITVVLSLLVISLGIWSIVEVARGTEAKAFESVLGANPPRVLTRVLGLCGGVLFLVIGLKELRHAIRRIRGGGRDQ